MKKITTSEDNLKQDEYGLYINAPNYEEQRIEMERKIAFNKKLQRQEEKDMATMVALALVVIITIIILIF